MDTKIEVRKGEKIKKWISIGILSTLLVALYFAFSPSDKKMVYLNKDDIQIYSVREDLFSDYISYLGYVEPIRTIYLDAVEGGIVEELYREEGTLVNKGDEILLLSNTDLHLNIMNSEAALAEQVNRLRDTKLATEQQYLNLKNQILEQKYYLVKMERAYERNKILYEEEYISEEEFLSSKEAFLFAKEKYILLQEKMKIDSINRLVQIQQLTSSLKRMDDNLKLVTNKLDNLLVKAPVSGELGTLNAEIGQSINRGERLGILNVLSDYKVRVSIDEMYAGKIRKGYKATALLSGQDYNLTVKKIYSEIKGGVFDVDLIFNDSIPSDIRTGISMRIKIEMSEPVASTVVKKGAFYQETGGKWVFVLDESGKEAVKKEIQVGKQNLHEIEIFSGLKAGDKIIGSNYSDFADAEVIKINY